MNPWDERYKRGEHGAEKPFGFLEELTMRVPPGSALDLACGTGRHSTLLARAGWNVTAVDGSSVALSKLTVAEPRVTAIHADLETAEFRIAPASWDLIVVTFYLQRSLFPAVREGVRPKGRVALAFPIADDRAGVKAMNPAYLIDPAELDAAFEGWLVDHRVIVQPEPPGRARFEFVAVRA